MLFKPPLASSFPFPGCRTPEGGRAEIIPEEPDPVSTGERE